VQRNENFYYIIFISLDIVIATSVVLEGSGVVKKIIVANELWTYITGAYASTIETSHLRSDKCTK